MVVAARGGAEVALLDCQSRVVNVRPDKPLHAGNRVVGIAHGTVEAALADEALLLRHGDNRARLALAHLVDDNVNTTIAGHADGAVQVAQIHAEHRHVCFFFWLTQ